MRNLLVMLSGARPDILAQCPSERVKFESLGWALVINSALNAVSMWFALAGPLGVNGFLAVLPALAWGFVILGIERWLITSLPPRGPSRLLMVLPRVLIALLLALILSTPFTLRIFQSEITAQVAFIEQQTTAEYTEAVQQSGLGQAVQRYQSEIAQLQQIIDKGPKVAGYQQAKALLPTTLSQLVTAQSQLTRAEAQASTVAKSDNGLLVQIQALGQLADRNPTLQAARLLVFLLFLVIGTLPLTVRLLQRPGVYEELLQRTEERDLIQARRRISQSPRSAGADWSLDYADYPRADTAVRAVWQQSELLSPDLPSPLPDTRPDPPISALRPHQNLARSLHGLATEPQLEPQRSDEHAAGHDEWLAVMDDPRDLYGPRNSGGIPLTWDDDDL